MFKSRQTSGGFSLVEVTIALAILSLAILPLIGLLPIGSNTLHTAIQQNIEAQIQQEMLSRLNTANWDDEKNGLAAFDQSTWYFDGQGAPVTVGSGAIYTVFLAVSSDFKLPGAVASNPYFCTVTMKVTDLPSSVQPFNNPAQYRVYVATLAKMDQ